MSTASPPARSTISLDNDDTNPLSSFQNETFAGGAEVIMHGTLAFNDSPHVFPAGNPYNYGDVHFDELPT
jgi:hypothetical protein